MMYLRDKILYLVKTLINQLGVYLEEQEEENDTY